MKNRLTQFSKFNNNSK